MKKQLIISALILTFLIITTTLIVLYTRGYRFSIEEGKPELSKTGLLATESIPNGAQVYINDHLTTATNDSISLSPGEYEIKIYKDGYFPWQKKLRIEPEVVTKAEALLFPTTPKLESITNLGANKPTINPLGTKIAFTVSSQQTLRKNGIYVFDMTTNPVLSFQGSIKQIVDDTLDNFSQAELSWSPDGEYLIASISGKLKTPTTYRLKAASFNDLPLDITTILATTQNEFRLEKLEKETSLRQGLKKKIREIINEYFSIIAWSPDETNILYVATKSAEIPIILKPRLLGINTLTEDRKIKEGAVYVYDTKEDINTKVLDNYPKDCLNNESCRGPITWFPDSKHLIHVHDKRIDILEYDGTNRTTIYAGPFIDNYVFAWPNGSKLVILTNLGNEITPNNLYTIGLK